MKLLISLSTLVCLALAAPTAKDEKPYTKIVLENVHEFRVELHKPGNEAWEWLIQYVTNGLRKKVWIENFPWDHNILLVFINDSEEGKMKNSCYVSDVYDRLSKILEYGENAKIKEDLLHLFYHKLSSGEITAEEVDPTEVAHLNDKMLIEACAGHKVYRLEYEMNFAIKKHHSTTERYHNE